MSEIAGIQQAVWLRAEGGCAVVLVEVDGEWVEIIREMLDSPFSHIKEPSADLVPAPPSQAQPDVTEATHRHVKTGGLYRVLHRAEIEADLSPCVVYQNVESGRTWVRPASEFDDGRFAALGTGAAK